MYCACSEGKNGVVTRKATSAAPALAPSATARKRTLRRCHAVATAAATRTGVANAPVHLAPTASPRAAPAAAQTRTAVGRRTVAAIASVAKRTQSPSGAGVRDSVRSIGDAAASAVATIVPRGPATARAAYAVAATRPRPPTADTAAAASWRP